MVGEHLQLLPAGRPEVRPYNNEPPIDPCCLAEPPRIRMTVSETKMIEEDGAHVPSVSRQTPVGHSLSISQARQSREIESQIGSAPLHWLFEMQPTHCPSSAQCV